MSEDLIKKEEAREAVCKGCLKDWGECRYHWDCPMLTNLEMLPTANRLHGEWIMHFDDLFPEDSTQECSVCHEEQIINGNDDNFCPNCGAIMKGESDE